MIRKPKEMGLDYVRYYLKYNPTSGEFKWNHKLSSKTKIGSRAGSISNEGYRVIGLKGKLYFEHRLAVLMMTGEWPIGIVDHIDGSKDCNKWDNLRDVSQAENMKNKKMPSFNSSGTIGIRQVKSGKWQARINVDGKELSLGTYATEDEAKEARKVAELEYGFHENHGR